VCFQVDQNADLAAFLIGHKLNAGHGSIFLQAAA
jgi:acyl CoA:acetate/3-ketoacid CoA transferase beta subunit